MDMKIAVSSSGDSLDSQIDPRFGRCAYFVIVDKDEMTFEAYVNKSAALSGGAGIQAAQFVADKGAEAVITGNLGPNAMQALSAANVEVFSGQSGIIREAIARLKTGNIGPSKTPNAAAHHGTGGRTGMGRGLGMGSGGGIRRGMGMGRGMRQNMGGSQQEGSGPPAPTALSKEDELKNLEDQAAALRRQIEAIESSLRVSKRRR